MADEIKLDASHVKCDLCKDQPEVVFLHAKCHLTAPLQAEFDGGVLTLRCYVPDCRRVVAQFRVVGIGTDVAPDLLAAAMRLEAAANAYAADQASAVHPQCANMQPVTVAEANELNDALTAIRACSDFVV